MINIIFAMSKNRVIGKDNQLPWRLSNELKYFKEVTNDSTVVMGRKTYESIGKPLPKRKNIVLSRDRSLKIDNVEICNSVIDILKRSYEYINEPIFIIGGAEIYKAFLPYTDKMYITMIDEEFEGDTTFPEFEDKFELQNESELKTEKDKVSGKELHYKFTIWKKNNEVLNILRQLDYN